MHVTDIPVAFIICKIILLTIMVNKDHILVWGLISNSHYFAFIVKISDTRKLHCATGMKV